MAINKSKQIFANNLCHYVEMTGKNGVTISDELGITPAAFSHWRNGKKYPSREHLQLLADYFGINVSDLTEDHESRVSPNSPQAMMIRSIENISDAEVHIYQEAMNSAFKMVDLMLGKISRDKKGGDK